MSNHNRYPRKVSCNVERLHGRQALRIRFYYYGKQRVVYPGLRDTYEDRKQANIIARQIESDVASGRFDETHSKYKVKRGSKLEQHTLRSLFSDFISYKQKHTYERTLLKYEALLKHLIDSGLGACFAAAIKEQDIDKFVRYLSDKCSDRQVRERLLLIQSCLRWDGIENVHLEAAIRAVRVSPTQPAQPFTKDEIKAILDVLETQFPEYVPFVKFVLLTGVRTGEARALRWKHVSDYGIWIGRCLTHGHERPAKSYKDRTIPLSDHVRDILSSLPRGQPNDHVFLSQRGKPIDEDNFAHRIWKPTLSLANVPYRKPYLLRHTFVSHALHSGVKPTDVAAITGHSLKTLYSTYAHAFMPASLPDLF
jgi:integrase